MPATTHMASAADDSRHAPGPGALPLWNESLWFPFYDPRAEIGVIFRVGLLPNQARANLYLFVTFRGVVVHCTIDHGLPLPATAPTRIALANGLTLDWTPRERFHLAYAAAAHGFDVEWRGNGPTYLYPHPPDSTAEEYPRHIEHGGRVTGTVTIAGQRHAVDALAHRDHSWGGERDWAKMWRWDYLSAELDGGAWVNAVRIKLAPETEFIHLGCLWDGSEMHALGDVRFEATYEDGGTRQHGVVATFADERGRAHRLVGEAPLVNCPVEFGRTWLKDAIVRYRLDDRSGFGIHELGWVEPD